MKTSSPLADALLKHWLKHPERQDSIEGIIEWWLLERHIEEAIVQVKSALNELVARNLVLMRCGADGQTYYKLNLQTVAAGRVSANGHGSRTGRAKIQGHT